jgi:hypothetical protein
MKFEPAANEVQFDRLMGEYRDACPVPEASANFMPQLWERIDASQGWTKQVWKWANSFAVAAALASLFFVMMQMLPRTSAVFASATYLETLDDQHDNDALAELAMTSAAPAQESPAK